MKDRWSMIKEFYKEAFGIPEGLVELASVIDILLLCVCGTSNKDISELFNVSIESVESNIKEWLNFTGWEKNLGFSPYACYKASNNNYVNFIDEIMVDDWNKTVTDYDAELLFRICQQYYKYEDMLNEQWY